MTPFSRKTVIKILDYPKLVLGVRLSIHVKFVGVSSNPWEELLENEKGLGQNSHFCLLWVIPDN